MKKAVILSMLLAVTSTFAFASTSAKPLRPFEIEVLEGKKTISSILVTAMEPMSSVNKTQFVELCMVANGNVEKEMATIEHGVKANFGEDENGSFVDINYTKIVSMKQVDAGGCTIEVPQVFKKTERVMLPVMFFENTLKADTKNAQLKEDLTFRIKQVKR